VLVHHGDACGTGRSRGREDTRLPVNTDFSGIWSVQA